MNHEIQKSAGRKFFRVLAVIAGIVFGQAVLYGPSLTGQKILLPLDLLAQPDVYLPQTPETAKIVPHNRQTADLTYQIEPARQFAASEIHQGRFPLWAPYQYGGVPFVWPKYSLFFLLACCVKSPVVLPWVQLFGALVAGGGMYFFCRRTLRVGFWPSAVCAWCYPLTAFFVLWQGFPTGPTVYWLPWIFLLVDKTVRGAGPLAVAGLSVVTFLVLTSGDLDIAGQVLLSSGIFALWSLWDARPVKSFFPQTSRAAAKLILGWGLGFLLAAPHTLPLLEYAQTGSRMLHRSRGAEERPPVGLTSLPEVLLPDLYGTMQAGSTRLVPQLEPNIMESAAAGYAGIFATLLVAPLGFCSRRHRTINGCLVFLALFGLSWCVDIPGFVQLLRLPGLNMMSQNRLVFVTAFAVLCLAAVGLENLLAGPLPRRWWFWLPAALLAGLCGWCVYRGLVLPPQIATQDSFDSFWRQHWGFMQTITDVKPVQAWSIEHYRFTAICCGLGFAGWLSLWFQKARTFLFFPVLAVFLLGDLLWFDFGRNSQSDPALYYPEIPALREVARSVPGRAIGVNCLPASLAAMAGLQDLRGDDAIEPARMVRLLRTSAAPGPEPAYATTQYMVPKGVFVAPDMLQLPPVLDMLGVRYAVFRGAFPQSAIPAFKGDDYWILVNFNALPRAFVPGSVETVATDREELQKLASPEFKPAEVAYVRDPVVLPAPCRGTVQITGEIPNRVTISARMETPGLVVLADNWDQGWHARYNGKPVSILLVNYAVRGVVVPAGDGILEFNYRPASLILGLWLAGFAAVVIICWLAITRFRQPKTGCSPPS